MYPNTQLFIDGKWAPAASGHASRRVITERWPRASTGFDGRESVRPPLRSRQPFALHRRPRPPTLPPQ